jgi:hypothetical protein
MVGQFNTPPQMKKILRSTVIAAASVASIVSIPHGKEGSRQKKQRTAVHTRGAPKALPDGGPVGQVASREIPPPPARDPAVILTSTIAPAPTVPTVPSPAASPVTEDCPAEPASVADRYSWKREIVTTTFWIGEKPSKNNPVPNRASAWDKQWAAHYGGPDTPDRDDRTDFRPSAFIPGQNPFYVALPYNDVQMDGHKPEAEEIIPWFKDEYRGRGKSVCKGRWVAIRFKNRVVYAQWEDCGPFRTDHSAYVFGDERPKKNLNKGAGLDVSPAVRDYLGMKDTDVTDWKFVEFEEVPDGPWAKYGDNNTFVINRRLVDAVRLALLTSGEGRTD